MNRSEVSGFGIDLGSTSAKFVEIYQGAVINKGISPSYNWKEFVQKNIPNNKGPIYSTGYFRKTVSSDLAITEITAAKKGVGFFFPDSQVDAILDIGGQDTKVIDLRTNNFILNDKCSAGTGAFLEFTAKYFGLPVEELNMLHKRATWPVKINNTCGVFAISEMISHLVKGEQIADVIAGMHQAWARRISHLIPDDIQTLAIIGGGAKNQGICQCLEDEFSEDVEMMIPSDPEFINAVGAVVYGCTNK